VKKSWQGCDALYLGGEGEILRRYSILERVSIELKIGNRPRNAYYLNGGNVMPWKIGK
jgi:hypothetical protein